jgi:LuxR family maltose regulon positive regulatory protein
MRDLPAARQQIRVAASLAAQFPGLDPITHRIYETRSMIDTAAALESASMPLTTAELRVLRCLPSHLSFQAIARELILSTNTVKTHAASVYRKLDVSSRADAVKRAQEQGLLS